MVAPLAFDSFLSWDLGGVVISFVPSRKLVRVVCSFCSGSSVIGSLIGLAPSYRLVLNLLSFYPFSLLTSPKIFSNSG